MMTAIQRILAVLATTALCACNPETSAPLPSEPSTQTFELGIGSSRLEVEVATTAETREIGLMNRAGMAKNHGMIFVFPADAQMCFWMKNTLIPLSVAFLSEDGTILNIEDMAPETEDNHCSAGLARFALEANQGWFAQRGIRPGDTVKGVKVLPAGSY